MKNKWDIALRTYIVGLQVKSARGPGSVLNTTEEDGSLLRSGGVSEGQAWERRWRSVVVFYCWLRNDPKI